jgi:hypothetical protein
MRLSWKVVGCVGIIIGIILGSGVYLTKGLSTEQENIITLCRYQEEKSCKHWGYLKPNILYDDVVERGDTIYIQLAEAIRVQLEYAYNCDVEGNISLDYSYSTYIKEPSQYGWTIQAQNIVYEEKAKCEESSSSAHLSIDLSYNITEVNEVINKIEEETGFWSSRYQIVIEVKGDLSDETTVGIINRPLNCTIVINLDYASGVITVVGPENHYEDRITEYKTEIIDGNIKIKKVSRASLFAWFFLAPMVTLWKYNKDKELFNQLSGSDQILLSNKITESEDLPEAKVQNLSTFEGLKDIAEDYGLKIFHKQEKEKDIFFATDYTILYKYVIKKEDKET